MLVPDAGSTGGWLGVSSTGSTPSTISGNKSRCAELPTAGSTATPPANGQRPPSGRPPIALCDRARERISGNAELGVVTGHDRDAPAPHPWLGARCRIHPGHGGHRVPVPLTCATLGPVGSASCATGGRKVVHSVRTASSRPSPGGKAWWRLLLRVHEDGHLTPSLHIPASQGRAVAMNLPRARLDGHPRTWLPIGLGTDEHHRRTLVLGWTGRVVIALWTYDCGPDCDLPEL